MGYNFEKFCKDYTNIENYDKALKDNFKGWNCHHRLETHNSDGERRLVNISAAELKALNMYYHRPASELIFLTTREHNPLHHKGNKYSLGKHFSEETKKKLSEANKGEKNPMYGKHFSEEHKKKLSEANKGRHHSEESKKKMSEAHKGKHHSEESKKKLSEANKGKKLSEETKKKLSEARKGRRWYNNGKISKRAKECPDGFVPGRIKKL